jgi:Raf kinase inhibitor-like YbhB/YbcL family protein
VKNPHRKLALLSVVIALFISTSCSPSSPPISTPADLSIITPQSLPTITSTAEPSPVPPTEMLIPATPTPEFIKLTSAAFTAGGMIPQQYSHRSEDISPPLRWGDPPEGTQSFVLIVISDPLLDGGDRWIQWILYNIPAETRSLPEGVTGDAEGMLPDGSRHYKNSWGELKYGGPNPPHASTFSYTFTLYALDTMLDLVAIENIMKEEGTLPWIGATRTIVLRAMEGHILAQGDLVGKYKEP